MAERGRGAKEGEGAEAGVSERSLFADVPYAEPMPVALPELQPGIVALPRDGAAPVPVTAFAPTVRLRRLLRR
jgi:competence protein ComEC